MQTSRITVGERPNSNSWIKGKQTQNECHASCELVSHGGRGREKLVIRALTPRAASLNTDVCIPRSPHPAFFDAPVVKAAKSQDPLWLCEMCYMFAIKHLLATLVWWMKVVVGLWSLFFLLTFPSSEPPLPRMWNDGICCTSRWRRSLQMSFSHTFRI